MRIIVTLTKTPNAKDEDGKRREFLLINTIYDPQQFAHYQYLLLDEAESRLFRVGEDHILSAQVQGVDYKASGIQTKLTNVAGKK